MSYSFMYTSGKVVEMLDLKVGYLFPLFVSAPLMTRLVLCALYVCMSTCYSAPSRFLLRGAPDYSADTELEFHAEAHEQLRVKDLPRVPTWRLEVDSNLQPSGCKAPNIPLHHRTPTLCVVFCTVLL